MPCAIAVPNSPIFSPSSRIPSILGRPPSLAPCSPSTRIYDHAPQTRSPPLTSSAAAAEAEAEVEVGSTLLFRIPNGNKDGGGSVLKRKRPARLDIPLVTSFGSGLGSGLMMTPRRDERLAEVEVEGEGYSVYCKRGKRVCQLEDRYSAFIGLNGDHKQALFGVFDGHGGAKAADFAAKNLSKNIMQEVSSSKCGGSGIEDAIRNGYLTTDAEFLKENLGGGACCVTALIEKGNVVVSNAGDCRAVMSRGGVAEALTSDHQPSRKDERDRIEALVSLIKF